MISPRDLTAVILAGGKTQTSGGPIPSVQNVDGRKVIERQAQVLKPKVAGIEVSVSAPVTWSRFPTVVDTFDSVGALAGIATALQTAATDWILIVGGAFAWIQPEVLDLLVARTGEPFDACAFRFDFTNPNPLFAIYHKRCAPRAAGRLERGDHDAMGLLTSESLAVRWIEDYELASFDPELATFRKVSTGEPEPPAEVEAPKTPVVVASTPKIAAGEGGHFAFRATPAYRSAIAFVTLAYGLAKLADAELGGELRRAALALPVAITNGTASHAAFACAALLDAMRALGVSDPRIDEGDQLLAMVIE